jgi:hypothetical protein
VTEKRAERKMYNMYLLEACKARFKFDVTLTEIRNRKCDGKKGGKKGEKGAKSDGKKDGQYAFIKHARLGLNAS